MKTKKRLFIILLLSIVLFGISAFVLEKLIMNKISVLLEQRLTRIKNETNRILLLESSPAKSYVDENSYWDELWNAVKKKDTAWVAENMLGPLSQNKEYAANFLWIIDTKGKDIYNRTFNNPGINDSLMAPFADFIKKLSNKQTTHFCFKQGDTYYQGFAASIVPGNDYIRVTQPVGYLLVGKAVNAEYLKRLDNINSNFEYFLESENSPLKEDFIDKQKAVITCFKTIPSLNSAPVVIKVQSSLPEIKAYTSFVRMALFAYLVFILVVIGILYRFFFRYFFTPVEKMTSALEYNDPLYLKNIKQKDTELGKIANLIDAFFKQNKELYHEIESRKKTEEELRVAAERLNESTIEKIRAEHAAEAKSEFLTTMSHEIRTPINGVIGVANLLKEETLSPRQKEYVDILSYSSKHLLSLISDILDFSKIETGKIEFDKNSFDLQKVCDSVYQVFRISAAEKKIALEYQPDLSLKQSVYGDSVRLNQVLTNLVGNAIKFTSKGTVSIAYKVISSTKNICTLEFAVKDTGIGIADEEQDRVFDGFSQANKSISSKFGGTGLGLSISKKLIEMQGGKLEMTSKLGHGTTFTFYITYETHAYNKILPIPEDSRKNKNDLNGMKVLVAEDNNINVIVIRRFLEKWGIYYQIARNGKEATEMVDKEDFDLVLMDIHMPEMDGEEATKTIRKHATKKISNIPIIALTANASIDTQQKLLGSGFTNYLSKPFNPDNLFKLLKKYYYENELC